MKNNQIRYYRKISKSYKRNTVKKILNKNVFSIIEYLKNKSQRFFYRFSVKDNLFKFFNLFQNRKYRKYKRLFQVSLLIVFVILFNLTIFAFKNKSENKSDYSFYSFNDKKFQSSEETYKKILSEMLPETDKSIEEDLLKMPKITSLPSIANIDGKVSDIFYDYITSDATLNSDGIIDMKYEEYTIGEGENLTSISRRIGANLDTIVSVNKISNANKLNPGQKIIIPNRNGLLYTVKANETIEEAADKYAVQLDKVLAFNKIESVSDIKIGDDIFLPGARYTLDERIEKFGQMFSFPTTITRISSVFGYRISPITGVRSKHTGVDIPGKLNTPVYAARKGKVIFAGYSGGYGNLVIVRHDKGYATYYGHLNKITAKIGDNVGVGVMIGRMGSTGNSTGSHLHFEVRRNGEALNPSEFIPIKKFITKR